MFQNQYTVCCTSSIILYNKTNKPTQPTEQQQKKIVTLFPTKSSVFWKVLQGHHELFYAKLYCQTLK